MTQTRVEMMVEEDVEHDTRLLLRSTSALSHNNNLAITQAGTSSQNTSPEGVNMALAMSTWNDVAVTYWHQVYIQSEESYQDWRRSGMADRFAFEKRDLHGRKAPVPATCDSVEALLRHELLAHIPEWLSRKAGVLGCTSSHTVLFMCWKDLPSSLHGLRIG